MQSLLIAQQRRFDRLLHSVDKLINSFVFHIVLLLLFSWFFFSENTAALFLPYDGGYMRQLVKFSFDWGEPVLNFTLNPLQGLGAYNFPINYWFSPAALSSYVINGPEPNAVVVYAVSSIELFSSLWFLAKSMGLSRTHRISTSWLGCVCVMPYIVPAMSSFVSFYAISGIIPYIVEHMAVSNIVLGLIIRLRFDRSKIDWVGLTALLAMVSYVLIVFAISAILSIPVWACFAFWSIATAFFKPHHRFRMLYISILCFGILLAPLLAITASLTYSVPAFFSEELVLARPALVFISLAFHGQAGLGWGSTLIYFASLCGAGAIVLRDDSALRATAVVFIFLLIAIMTAGLLTSFVFTSYRGPSFLYFEWFIWGLMFVFSCICFTKIISFLQCTFGANSLISNTMCFLQRSAGILIPLVTFFCILVFNNPSQVSALQMPPNRTNFVKILELEIGLRPGMAWRGSVVTFNGLNQSGQGTSWSDNVGLDAVSWQVAGNDHRAIGLWWYNIPTMFAYNQYMTPYYYYVMTRLFAEPSDQQQRSVLVFTHPGIKLLGLFGARYIITEKQLADPGKIALVDTFRWEKKAASGTVLSRDDSKKPMYLYEITESNLGTFTPTQAVKTLNAREAISQMKTSYFDPRLHFTIDAPFLTELVPCTQARMIWEKNKIRVSARSSGTSLLVLPLEFSNTFRIEPAERLESSSLPRLMRVDIALTGLLFSGKLDALIVPQFGPFEGAWERFRDNLDAKRAGF